MKNFLEFVKTYKGQNITFIALLFIIIISSFFKVAVLNYVPQAHDNIQYKGVANVSKEYEKENDEKALWNSNIFSGMPNYMIALSKSVPFITDLRKITNPIINWRIFLLFTASVGMYIFLLSLGFIPFIAFIGSLAFAFSPHFIGLIEIGHNTKFRAAMYIPWMMWAFRRLQVKPSLLSIGFAITMLIGQLSENHPQITYYTMIMVGIFWIVELIAAIKDKKFKSFAVYTGLLLVVGTIALISVADPYLYDYEYGKYTIRGGSEGLSTSYATGWSFHPAEILSFVFPGVFGNVSPTYWGWMPFTQVGNYFGVILFVLSLFGLSQWKRNRMVQFLGSTVIVTLFFSFGRHLPFLSNLLLKFFPLFNKFRVPAMILIVTIFAMITLAMYGLQFIIKKKEDKEFQSFCTKLFYGSIALFVVALLLQGAFTKISFIKDGELGRYAQNQLTQLRAMRHEVFLNSLFTSLGFILAFLGTIFAFVKSKLKTGLMLFFVAGLIFFDIYYAGSIFLKDVVKEKRLDTKFVKTSLDDFLLADEEPHRIYPLGREFGSNNWAYYHQTVGGYHAAKLKRYQEIIENCMNYELEYKVPINWNILNMLNTKYVLFDQKLPLENLEFVHFDQQKGMKAFLNKDYLKRAWFVDNIEVLSTKEKIWSKLNTKDFKPQTTAIVEKAIPGIEKSDSTSVVIQDWDLHEIKLKTYNNKQAFLVLSEVYYPAGWNVYIDDKKSEIYATNYILRGIKVPAGDHEIVFKFEPQTYTMSKTLSLIGILLTILLVGLGGYLEWKRWKKGEIEYVFV